MFEKDITHKIQLNKNYDNAEIVNLLKESLLNIGFINVRDSGNKISFRGNQKDKLLESFQRRYREGEFSFIQENDSIVLFQKLTFIKLFKTTLIWDAVFLLVVNLIISFKGGESKRVYYLMFNLGLVVSNLISYTWSYLFQKNKLIKLFEIIEQGILRDSKSICL